MREIALLWFVFALLGTRMNNEYIPLLMLLIFGGVLGALGLLSDAATRMTQREEAEKRRLAASADVITAGPRSRPESAR
jgi:hypothetical protein